VNFPDPNKLHYFQLTVIPGNFLNLLLLLLYVLLWWKHNSRATKCGKLSSQRQTNCNAVMVSWGQWGNWGWILRTTLQ